MLQGRRACIGIQIVDTKGLERPVERAGGDVVFPAADFCGALALFEQGLAAAEGFLDAFLRGYVADRAGQPCRMAGSIAGDDLAAIVDPNPLSVAGPNSIINVAVALLQEPFARLFEVAKIIGMHQPVVTFDAWLPAGRPNHHGPALATGNVVLLDIPIPKGVLTALEHERKTLFTRL